MSLESFIKMFPKASWMPSASIDMLSQRAAFMAKIRQFFNARGYLEVETPMMARFGVTDVYLSNIKARFRGEDYALQTSPEYHMKRLLAYQSGSIFQLARVFRDDELGRWHNPEFTMLEWYRLDFTAEDLIAEVDRFLQEVAGTEPSIQWTYQDVFLKHAGLDPFTASIDEFKKLLKAHDLANVLAPDEEDRDQYLFLLMSHIVEPQLANYANPVAIYHFPPSQAALAEVKEGVAKRFEFYYKGVELANGFQELLDPKAQEARFQADIAKRSSMSLELPAMDHFLLDALKSGLPSCSGVALGVDRLLALALNQKDISMVLAFDFSKA